MLQPTFLPLSVFIFGAKLISYKHKHKTAM